MAVLIVSSVLGSLAFVAVWLSIVRAKRALSRAVLYGIMAIFSWYGFVVMFLAILK